MSTNIVVPALGESVVEATISRWLKKEGDPVEPGDTLVELETDKVNLEVGAERAGILAKIERKDGEDVKVGDLLGVIEENSTKASAPVPERKPEEPAISSPAEKAAPKEKEPETVPENGKDRKSPAPAKATPSARRMAQELGVDIGQVKGSGAGNQITRQDVQSFSEKKKPAPQAPSKPSIPAPTVMRTAREERIKMSRRRRTIAQRMIEAQHNAAMLTTFNEVDMTLVMDIRKRHKESFKERYGIGLGIVSFFVKASIGALKDFPELNAEIQGDEIVFKHYYDIGVAIGATEGLVVPVLRDADRMSFSEIEKQIKDFGSKSEAGTLTLEDLRGGTFTITNGGVYGSLLSTPILNPPQVAILGLHKIEERPIAMNGQVVIRPMMYIALSYDHRIVDGRQSVQFLARIKHLLEDPASLLLEG
jgi:2-oxoglutarate dehydrogenase E2 component (dihydrolipoamide succinyltransferase)